VGVVTEDMEAALKFWRDALGLTVDRTERNDDEEVEIVGSPIDRATDDQRRTARQRETRRLRQLTDDVEQPLLERGQHDSSTPRRSAIQSAQARRM